MANSRGCLPGLRDTRGAILVLGLALGVVLALGVKTLLDVGSAVLDRELAQSAADAAAFESATWQARGMNMVATLNVAIALVLGVLVVWRLATFAVGLACLLEVAASLQQPGAPRRELPELRSFAKLLDEDARVAGSVVLVASALRVSQTAVAAYTPVLAAHASARDTKEAFDVASGTFSASLLTSNSGKKLTGVAECAGSPTSSGRLGAPFSLPVEPDEPSLACLQAVRRAREAQVSDTAEIGLGLNGSKARALRAFGLSSKGESASQLAQALSGVFDGAAPSVFCAPAGSDVEALRKSMWSLAVSSSDSAPDSATRALLERRTRRSQREVSGPRTLDDARSIWGAWRRALESGQDPESCLRPARVWSPAQNGNGYFRTASASEVRSLAVQAPGEPSRAASLRAVAHAEVFFDCADVWNNCRATALWEPNWRARLRRVRSFRSLLAPVESNDGSTRADARVDAERRDRATRQLDALRSAPDGLESLDALDARPELLIEPEPIAGTRAYQLLDSAPHEEAGARALAAFVARHANDSSVIH